MRSNFFQPPGPAAPVVLQSGPTATDIVAAVNANTARVRSYYTNSAKFSVPGMSALPLLKGSIALERPLNFRLRAGIALTGGDEIDLGSNADMLWFWVKRNTPPAMYYCRHDQFASSGASQVLPVDPSWIGDALGLVELNPASPYEGPMLRGDGAYELRAPISTPSGPMTRTVVVDAKRAWVLEQHLYDSTGGPPVASALAEDFRYDPQAQVSLPRRVTIRVPASDLSLVVDVGQVAVNVPIPNATAMWSPPALEGYPRVDLGTTAPGVTIDTSAIPSVAVLPPVQSMNGALPATNFAIAAPEAPATSPAAFAPLDVSQASFHSAPAASPPTASAPVYQLPSGGVALDPTPFGQ